MKEILIELADRKSSLSLEKGNIIHQKEFKEAQRFIKNLKSRIYSNASQLHETITILGTRGSGKTTFLTVLLDECKNDEDLSVLDLFDPTLIEEKGHIFLTILSAIAELVEEKLALLESNTELIVFDREAWEKSLNRLANGLPLIDGIGMTMQEASWQDPEFIMEKGMESVRAARKLKDNFNNCIDHALQILGKKAFLIAFDDIDIDFRKGWPVLEMIRKYFFSSKIVTILSGDLRLYSLAIRKQHWVNFGKDLLDNESVSLNKINYFNDLVTEMEGQYMLKVLKPEMRVHLSTLYEKTRAYRMHENNENEILVRLGEKKIEITTVYKELLAKFGISNNYQSEAYSSFLLGLPLRTQVQFLTEYSVQLPKLGQMNVFDPFLSDLLEKRVDVNLLESTPKLLNAEILKLLLRERQLGDVYQLQPTTGDTSLNGCVLSLSLFFTQQAAVSPHLIFDYFIKVGYVRNQLNALQYVENDDSSSLLLTPSIEGFCKHTGVFQDKVLRDIAGNMSAYLRGAFPNNNLGGGMIPLMGLATPSKQGEREVSDRIDSVFRNRSKSQIILGFIPLSISSFITKNQTIPCYSIYTLLATVGEIIRKVDENDLERGLSELSQVRTYLIPEFRKRINEGNITGAFLAEGIEASSENIKVLSSEINNWVKRFPNQFAISPHLLGKISTRLFYALNTIENNEEITNLGDMMHAKIRALLNAILLEDARENAEEFNEFNINNTNFSDQIFINNVKAALRYRVSLPFSSWMLACPLFKCYLRPSADLDVIIDDFSNDNFNRRQLSVYNLLAAVSVKGKRQFQESGKSANKMYVNLIAELKDKGISRDLFLNNSDKAIIRENNKEIRQLFRDLNIVGEWDSFEIRKFRNFLEKSGKTW